MNLPVVNIDDVELEPTEVGELFAAKMAQLNSFVGSKKLGYRICVVPPGKRAWPRHAHLVNEEMVFVISGRGLLRYGNDESPLRAGDVIAFVPGPDTPHQIVNSSEQDLKYLCVSTMEEPEIVLYPDSEKYGVLAGSAPGGDKADRTFEVFAKRGVNLPYWEGEV